MGGRYGISDVNGISIGISIWGMVCRYEALFIDMVIHHIDMVILYIDMEYSRMIWEMTVSIWSSPISIRDISYHTPFDNCLLIVYHVPVQTRRILLPGLATRSMTVCS